MWFSGWISPFFWSLDLSDTQLTSPTNPKPSYKWGPKAPSSPAQALWLWQLQNAFSLELPGFKVVGLLLARNKLLWVLNSSSVSPESQMGSWMSHFWWLALNRKFCKWFLAGALITFLLRFISTAEFSFAFFSLCTMQLNGWPSYAEGNASIRDEKNSLKPATHSTRFFKPALHQFSEEMKKEMHMLGIPGLWDTHFPKTRAHKCTAFLNEPFGLEKYSKRKKKPLSVSVIR